MRILASFLSVLIAGTLNYAIAQENIPSMDELLQRVPQLSNISGLENFNASSVKTEEFEKLFREKCEKNGGSTAYNVAKESPIHLTTCLQSLVNVTQLQNEMEAARPHGELDTVFKKYCRRVPNLKQCVKNVTDAIDPCLESEEHDNVKIIHNITNSLLEFICHNEGDRIAMFIAAGGVECFRSKQQAVGVCANETFRGYIPAANPAGGVVPGITSIPLLVLSLKECTDIEKFRTCSVKVLEECEDPTPANVVDSLFQFVKKVTPCQNLLTAQASAATADNAHGSAFSETTGVLNAVLITTAMFLSLRFA